MTTPVIDVHVHAIPAEVNERAEAGRSPHVRVERLPSGLASYLLPAMEPSPPAPASLCDFAGLASSAAEHGITTQLVGPWTDLLGYTLPEAEGEAWAQAYNEALVRACAEFAGMQPMATVPLQAPRAAVRVMESAKSFGCRGLVFGTDIPESELAAPELDDVWAAAAELWLPVLLHPTFLTIPAVLKQSGLKNAVGRAGVTALALTRIIYAGVLERHPDLVLIGAHGGGAFVPLIDRILRNQELGWAADTDVDVAASIQRLYVDSVVLDSTFLAYVVGKLGAGRMLLGSDWPFPWEPDPLGTVQRAGLDADETDAVLGHTAQGLFGI
ncbi:MAG: amidohydrolase family protein [Chloroflexota bacterium]